MVPLSQGRGGGRRDFLEVAGDGECLDTWLLRTQVRGAPEWTVFMGCKYLLHATLGSSSWDRADGMQCARSLWALPHLPAAQVTQRRRIRPGNGLKVLCSVLTLPASVTTAFCVFTVTILEIFALESTLCWRIADTLQGLRAALTAWETKQSLKGRLFLCNVHFLLLL